MHRLAAVLFTLALSYARGSAPDVARGPINFTGVGNDSSIFVGAGAQNGAIAWRLTYFVDGTNITAAQLAIQGANSANQAGCVAAVFTTIATVNADVVESVNPSVSGPSGNVAVKSFYPCIRMRVTAVTGSGGTVMATLQGWRGTFVFPAIATIAPGTPVTVVQPVAGNLQSTVTYSDSAQLSPFGRVRAAQPTALFDTQFQYGLQPLLWQSVITGGATAVHQPNASSVLMTVSTNGDQIVRQSHQYLRYQPGKGQLIFLTGVMGIAKANTRQRIGYFDAQNGLFFEQDGTNLRVVQRSFTSGSAVDTAVNQSACTLDPLNGTGPSGITLNMADAQLFVIDLQWLGVGRVRMGFDIGGQVIFCHQFLNQNALTGVYMTTPNLPVRYELTMTGATTATSMTQICQSVISEGGFDDKRGLEFTANNGITVIAVTTRRPILSIRPKTTFNSITVRGLIEPQSAETEIGSGTALVEIVYNGVLTGASFASVDTNSLTERDVAATAITGGTVVLSYYVSGGGATARVSRTQDLGSVVGRVLGLSLDAGGTVPDILSMVVTSFAASVDATGAFGWKEIY